MSNPSLTIHRIPISSKGFTLIELMILVAIIAIIFTLALPVYSNYTIRAKIGEAISVAAAAKAAVAATCVKDPTLTAITGLNTGYKFDETTRYVAGISLSGSCSKPLITVQTQMTGAIPDPAIFLLGGMDNGRMQFTCSSSGLNTHVPRECRS